MNLKEAFRFQNKLNSLMEQTQGFLADQDNLIQVETTYLRKKACPDAEDETVLRDDPSEYCKQINKVMDFCLYLLKQKELLSQAIHSAKAALPMDMDSQVTLNNCRQNMARVFAAMAGIRSSEVLMPGRGTGYRFNAEGNQITYYCDIRRVTTIHFDRNKAKSYMAQLNRQADEMSVELDKGLINSHVDYQPPFDVNSSFQEALETYLETA